MLALIKFGYAFVLPPGLWVLVLGGSAVWLWVKKGRRRMARWIGAMALLLYVTSIPLIAEPLMHSLEGRYVTPEHPQGDVIVVLTGGAVSGSVGAAKSVGTEEAGAAGAAKSVGAEETTGSAKSVASLESAGATGTGELTPPTSARLVEAVRLYRQLGVPILVSGGAVFVDSANEGELAKQTLLALGVPSDRILLDNRSRNTHENAEFSAELLKLHGLTHPLLVTSAFHMPRAVREFAKAGVAVVPDPTAYTAGARVRLNLQAFAPGGEAVQQLWTAGKEYLGMLALAIR